MRGFKRSRAGIKESEIQRQVAELCRRAGWYYIRSRFDRPTTIGRGAPDFVIACRGGVVLWVEVKRIGGRLGPEQEEVKRKLERLGQRYLVINSIDDLIKEVGLE